MIHREKVSMPWLQYFGVVGFCLLAAMFVSDAYLPKSAPQPAPPSDYGIRIASKKVGPEAVTFSGNAVDYGVRIPVVIAQADRTQSSFASADVADVQSSAKKRMVERTLLTNTHRGRRSVQAPVRPNRDRAGGSQVASRE